MIETKTNTYLSSLSSSINSLPTHSQSHMLCSVSAWQKNAPFFVNCGHQSTHPSIHPSHRYKMPLACILNAPSPTSFLIPVIRCLLFLGFPVDFVEPMNDGMQGRYAPGCPLERGYNNISPTTIQNEKKLVILNFAGRCHATVAYVTKRPSVVSGTSFEMKCLCE